MTSTATILYVDDDSDECLLLKTSLEDAGSPATLVYAHDGEEAVAYLNSVDPQALPQLIIMDLNMPRWDGRRTLQYLKSQQHLAGIPVVIFSTSESPKEREACTQMGAASYLHKPSHYDGYKNIAANFITYLKA